MAGLPSAAGPATTTTSTKTSSRRPSRRPLGAWRTSTPSSCPTRWHRSSGASSPCGPRDRVRARSLKPREQVFDGAHNPQLAYLPGPGADERRVVSRAPRGDHHPRALHRRPAGPGQGAGSRQRPAVGAGPLRAVPAAHGDRSERPRQPALPLPAPGAGLRPAPPGQRRIAASGRVGVAAHRRRRGTAGRHPPGARAGPNAGPQGRRRERSPLPARGRGPGGPTPQTAAALLRRQDRGRPVRRGGGAPVRRHPRGTARGG